MWHWEDLKLANTKAAEKAIRQNDRRRERNRWFISRTRTFMKKTLKAIESGDLLRADVVNDMMERRLYEADTNSGFILDGYPRTPSQAGFLDRTLLARGFPAPRVIVLELDDDTALERTRSRGRADDRAGMAPGRLAEYRKVESLLKQHYKAQLLSIDAKPDARAVEAAIRQALGY